MATKEKIVAQKNTIFQKVKANKGTTALWMAVLTALGSQGIPKIVELLENKPSVEDVQTIVAKKTLEINRQLNNVIKALKEGYADMEFLRSELEDAQRGLAHLTGRSGIVEDVIRDCCTRKRVVEKLETKAAEPVLTMEAAAVGPALKKAIEDVEEVPEFQQLQLQFQEEH